MANALTVPRLESYCGSWVVSRKDGTVIGEFFLPQNVALFSADACTVETTHAYLCRVNERATRREPHGAYSL